MNPINVLIAHIIKSRITFKRLTVLPYSLFQNVSGLFYSTVAHLTKLLKFGVQILVAGWEKESEDHGSRWPYSLILVHPSSLRSQTLLCLLLRTLKLYQTRFQYFLHYSSIWTRNKLKCTTRSRYTRAYPKLFGLNR